MEKNYKVEKTVVMDDGSEITVTVTSSEPVNPKDYLILREDAMKNMGECLASMGMAMAPPK